MSTLKIGFIGCGAIAERKHLAALEQLKDICTIVAFCDIKEEKAIALRDKYGNPDATVYTDYNDMLTHEDIDVVHVLTPNVVHCSATVAAFEAGKHVLCEKPMAHCTEDAQKMMDAWKKSGKKFTVGYQNRFRAEVQMLYKACRKDELGEIYYAKAHAVRRRAVPTWGVFPNKSLQGGGPLIDIGTHALDITLWMMDNYEPKTVLGSVYHKLGTLPVEEQGNTFGPWDPDTFEVEDSAFGTVKMANGATINIEAAWALNVLESKEASTTLCGTKAGAEILSGMSYPQDDLIINRCHNGKLTEEEITKPKGQIAYFRGGAGEPGFLEAKQWLDAIINDSEPLVKPEQAFAVTQILDAIYQSDQSGKAIEL